ncbi:MAG: VCBS repeat-containing protein [bacterium]|nr:VCBS repeat-containing protein [bacterium]
MSKKPLYRVYWLLFLWLGFYAFSALPAGGKSEQDKLHPVSYSKKHLHTYRQRYSVTKEPSQITSADLRPLVSLYQDRFFYNYKLLEGTPLQSIPLSLRYETGGGEDGAGLGWEFAYTFILSNPAAVNVISPEISYSGGAAPQNFTDSITNKFVYVNSEIVPVQAVPGKGKDILAAKKEYHGRRFFFLKPGEYPLVLPYKIQDKTGEPVIFQYAEKNGRSLLQCISRGKFSLRFSYGEEPAAPPVRVTLSVKKEENHVDVKYWLFSYQTAGVRNERFLRHITVHAGNGSETTLHFSYGIFDQETGVTKKTVDWYSPDAPPAGVWKLQQNNRRPLPRGKTIKNNPGLRFIDLNCDTHLDLVETAAFGIDSWLWDPETNDWKSFGRIYKPDRPSIHRKNKPTGSHYINLWKAFKDKRFNTKKHQAVITAYYKPTRDLEGLEYHNHVCFPKVFLDKLDPDGSGSIWERVCDERLKLPVPLQYEGVPWPRKIPGISAEEGFTNQGARFVQFTKDGCINLLYIGKRYRDAATGEILLKDIVTHRDTCNCREWYETEWENEGVKRKVKVDLCQGFWKAEKEYWHDTPPGNPCPGSFWQRIDLGPGGEPLDCYILPWQDHNPRYYHHYLGFKSVKFVALDPGKTFMIVHNPVPVNPGGPAADIYRLCGENWLKLEKESGYYPPDVVLAKRECLFLDLDNDGRDDLIVPHGNPRKVFINMGKGENPRWKRCPAFDIPWNCDLVDGGAQFVDINIDGCQDLIFGDGGSGLMGSVYINQSISAGNSCSNGMTVFTDEWGNKRPVKDIK